MQNAQAKTFEFVLKLYCRQETHHFIDFQRLPKLNYLK